MVGIALVGLGKIARDQHMPALAEVPAFELVATVDPQSRLDGVPGFPSLQGLLASGAALDAVAICTPPAVRHRLAAAALDAGLHVLLEKPPAATLSQVDNLVARAAAGRQALFASWHSRHADGVEPAREWLADRRIDAVRVDWREDVDRWHPGQDWILADGGQGVFDPGINALSILTAILPEPPMLRGATLRFAGGSGAPVSARLAMAAGCAGIDAEFDFREKGRQIWSIEVDTDAGTLRLEEGGRKLLLPDGTRREGEDREYVALYRRFAELVATRAIDADSSPLKLVADAFLIGTRETVAG